MLYLAFLGRFSDVIHQAFTLMKQRQHSLNDPINKNLEDSRGQGIKEVRMSQYTLRSNGNQRRTAKAPLLTAHCEPVHNLAKTSSSATL